ncbi:MAG: hypothetical protein WCR42_10595 [bacterium]
MERVKIYRIKKKSIKYFMIIGAVLLVAGVILSLRFIIEGIDSQILPLNMMYLPFTSMGFLLIIFGYLALNDDKYFFAWDDVEIAYLLPKQKDVEIIKITDIKGIVIQLFEITIKLADGEKKLNLENIEYAEFQTIKNALEKIRL